MKDADGKCSPHGWTLDTLEQTLSKQIAAVEKYFTDLSNEREDRNKERFSAMKTAVDAALASSDRAVSKAEVATEKRFEGVNEFRSALSDQSSTLLPRSEYAAQYQTVIDRSAATDKRIAELQASISTIQDRGAGKAAGVGYVGIIVLGTLTGLASITAVASLIFALTRGLK